MAVTDFFFFFWQAMQCILIQANKNLYERNWCQQVILIINLILSFVFLMCSLWHTLIDATRRVTIFGGGWKNVTLPKIFIVCSTHYRTPYYAIFQDQNTKEIWLAIQSAPCTLSELNTSVNEKLLDFRQQILQLDQKVRAAKCN